MTDTPEALAEKVRDILRTTYGWTPAPGEGLIEDYLREFLARLAEAENERDFKSKFILRSEWESALQERARAAEAERDRYKAERDEWREKYKRATQLRRTT